MKHIQIRNSDMAWHIAANIQFPPNFDESKQYPAIISVHPFGSCKEQTSGNIYGKALAEKGYLVLAYDASFQGESGGEPRWIEDPTQRVEDISRVIDYAVTLPYVNAERIGVLGVCGGGGYAINAALTEKRIKKRLALSAVGVQISTCIASPQSFRPSPPTKPAKNISLRWQTCCAGILKMQFARRELKRRFHIYRQPGRSVKIGETDLRHQR